MSVSRRGFTLVEVLVALGVLAVGIGGVIAMFAAATATHRKALEQTTAAIVADTVIAEQRAAFNRGRFSEAAEIGEAPAPGFDLYTVSVTPTVVAREPETGRTVQLYLEVRVHYQSRGKRRTTLYRTMLFRE